MTLLTAEKGTPFHSSSVRILRNFDLEEGTGRPMVREKCFPASSGKCFEIIYEICILWSSYEEKKKTQLQLGVGYPSGPPFTHLRHRRKDTPGENLRWRNSRFPFYYTITIKIRIWSLHQPLLQKYGSINSPLGLKTPASRRGKSITSQNPSS